MNIFSIIYIFTTLFYTCASSFMGCVDILVKYAASSINLETLILAIPVKLVVQYFNNKYYMGQCVNKWDCKDQWHDGSYGHRSKTWPLCRSHPEELRSPYAVQMSELTKFINSGTCVTIKLINLQHYLLHIYILITCPIQIVTFLM